MMSHKQGASVEEAVAELRRGQPVIVTDDADRENEGDLVMPAEDAEADKIAFMVRNTTGILCAPMTGERLDELGIGLMVNRNSDPHRTAFTVSVDHISTTTGVSAMDRSATVRALAEPDAVAGQFQRPGHVFPLRAAVGGVLARAGHTEAAIDLMRLAGKRPAAVIGEIVNHDGTMANAGELAAFGAEHSLATVAIADLVRYRHATEKLVVRSGEASLPTRHGSFRALTYTSLLDGIEHLVLVAGQVGNAEDSEPVLVRVHSECLTGDVFGSQRCDCGTQLDAALDAISAESRGIFVYLRGHEGRGIGLAHKLRAYELQEGGKDTVDANIALGLPVDSRDYGVGAQILRDLGVRRVRLITNNPAKSDGLGDHGIEVVGRHALPTTVTAHNVDYLRTKRDRLGHAIRVPEMENAKV